MSAEVKHTPGPWRFELWSSGKSAVVSDFIEVGGDDDWVVCEFSTQSPSVQADGRLIAAVPDMLAERGALQALVDEQANDEGLWFIVETAAEAYLQQELRRLHAAIEGKSPAECARAVLAAAEGSWECPIGHPDCTKNCGNYGCGN